MAHEILSIKLRELEDQVARLISRIRLSESTDRAALRREIEELELECAESRLALQKKLQLSLADIVSIIAHAYVETERVISEGKDALQEWAAGKTDPNAGSEEKILVAEYALDFAVQAANRALLLSMEAIEAQPTRQEERITS